MCNVPWIYEEAKPEVHVKSAYNRRPKGHRHELAFETRIATIRKNLATQDERLEKLGGDMKLGECYQIGLCSLACPKGLNPRGALKHLQELYTDYEHRKNAELMDI